MNFEQFIEAVKQQMQPSGRVEHLVEMLQQLFALTPPDVTLADVAAGWQVLSHPRSPNEAAPVAHRRQICAHLSAIAPQQSDAPGNLTGALKTWQAWRDSFERSADPRQAAMAKTLARELAELQSAGK
jgi:hypothetical protein